MNAEMAAVLFRALRHFSAPGWRGAFLARCLGIVLRAIGPRRDVALANLRRAFPDVGEAWYQTVVTGVYRHLGWAVTEYAALLRDPDQALDWCTPDAGIAELDRCRAEKRGAVLMTGHFGNWELAGAWFSRQGYPFSAIVRRHNDPSMEDLIEGARSLVGFPTLDKQEPMRRVVRRLRDGGFVAILIDQRADQEGIPVPFFGVPASTYPGAAVLARLAQVPIIPVFLVREAPFRHKILIGPPLMAPPGLDRDGETLALMTEANQRLERVVRRHPEQWLWMHRRWP